MPEKNLRVCALKDNDKNLRETSSGHGSAFNRFCRKLDLSPQDVIKKVCNNTYNQLKKKVDLKHLIPVVSLVEN